LFTLSEVKRSYGQYCTLAKTLDVVGGRWTLLVVRELLGGPRRFGDLMDGLPGIGTNLLSERLRELQEAGVIEKRVLPPPAGSTVYELTERGRELRGAALTLTRWGLESAGLEAPAKDEEFRVHWLMVTGQAAFRPEAAGDAPLICEVRTSDSDVSHFRIEDGELGIFQGPASDPDLALSGTPSALIRLFTGRVAPKKAIENGVVLHGDLETLQRAVEAFGLSEQSDVA
jgi:DNA-binding HxlR family transcriptional regulator